MLKIDAFFILIGPIDGVIFLVAMGIMGPPPTLTSFRMEMLG